MIKQLKLCLVTDKYDSRFIQDAISGGITCIQYRDKTKNFDELFVAAFSLKALLAPSKIPLIINDNVELAKLIDADGVHLGQSDLAIDEARKLLGPTKIIGLSIENLDQLEKANQLNSINYVAASALFPTPSKINCKNYWGLAGLKQFVQISKHPAITIGGINLSNINSVMACGVIGVAVISAIQNSLDVRQAAQNLIYQINIGQNYAR